MSLNEDERDTLVNLYLERAKKTLDEAIFLPTTLIKGKFVANYGNSFQSQSAVGTLNLRTTFC